MVHQVPIHCPYFYSELTQFCSENEALQIEKRRIINFFLKKL